MTVSPAENKKFSPSKEECSSSSSLLSNLVSSSSHNTSKTVSSVNLSFDVVASSQKFARLANKRSWSQLVEESLIEYMLKHHSELPVETTFNISIHEDRRKVVEKKTCTIVGCKGEQEIKILYIPRNEEHFVCSSHLAEFKNPDNRRNWKVLK